MPRPGFLFYAPRFLLTCLGCVAIIASNPALADPPAAPAQGPTDAGQIMQDIERGQAKKPLQQLPKPDPKSSPEADKEEKNILVKSFKFEGNQLFSSEQLAKVLEPLVGHPISLTELKNAVNLVTGFYQKKGYLAVVTLPAQDITEGEVTLKILESKLGKIKVDGEYRKDFFRINPGTIKGFAGAYLKEGQPINMDDLNHGLSNTNDLPGVRVSSTLQPGEGEGMTDVLISVKDKPFYKASLTSDNSGGRSIGRNRYLFNLDLSGPMHLGDSINLLGLHTMGSDFAKLGYEIPIFSQGLRAGVSYSRLEYEVILDGFKKIPQGNSDTKSVNLSYAFINRQHLVYGKRIQ